MRNILLHTSLSLRRKGEKWKIGQMYFPWRDGPLLAVICLMPKAASQGGGMGRKEPNGT